MKNFRVEFSTSGYTDRGECWEPIDDAVSADNIQQAIELAIDWLQDRVFDVDPTSDVEVRKYAWRASEITYDEDGYLNSYEWEFKED